MGSIVISTGSPPKRRAADAATARRRSATAATALAVLVAAFAAPAAAADPELLPNERAFAFGARALDERTVEARFAIADGYYLYREKLKFTLSPGTVGAVSLPPGKLKDDEFFGRVETYRQAIAVRLPLQSAAAGQAVTVSAESQGCADIGVCYPPQVQKVTVVLPPAGGKPGPVVEAAPAHKWFN